MCPGGHSWVNRLCQALPLASHGCNSVAGWGVEGRPLQWLYSLLFWRLFLHTHHDDLDTIHERKYLRCLLYFIPASSWAILAKQMRHAIPRPTPRSLNVGTPSRLRLPRYGCLSSCVTASSLARGCCVGSRWA